MQIKTGIAVNVHSIIRKKTKNAKFVVLKNYEIDFYNKINYNIIKNIYKNYKNYIKSI